jgi:hypothetical protein
MKTPAFVFIALAVSVSAFSQTSAPAAPTLTAGAVFKGLRFDWGAVPGATWYQLEYRAHQTGAFLQQGDDYPATATSTHFSFPLHLFDWTYARYRLAACNSAGCSRSAEVSVSALRRDAVGYFKAAASKQGGLFGDSMDLSPDGYNLVTSAPGEVTPTADGSNGGAVYIFKRGSDGKWLQRSRLDVHATSQAAERVGLDVAISASGNTVAVGQASTIVDAASNRFGQLDVFFQKDNVWSRTRIPRPNVDTFGESVALSESGYLLAVGAHGPDQTAAIYKSVNGVWQNVRNFARHDRGFEENCDTPTLTRDGTQFAEICFEPATATRQLREYIRVYSGNNWSVRYDINLDYPVSMETKFAHLGLGLDRTGNTVAVQFARVGSDGFTAAFVQIMQRDSYGYRFVTQIPAGPWRNGTDGVTFGDSVALSGDGLTLTIGDPADNGTGWGPRAAPLVADTAQTGAVYIYRFTSQWRLVNMVKPNYNPNPGSEHAFGRFTALSQTGKTLVIGVPEEDSSAKGIDGNWANSSLPSSGAIFMY